MWMMDNRRPSSLHRSTIPYSSRPQADNNTTMAALLTAAPNAVSNTLENKRKIEALGLLSNGILDLKQSLERKEAVDYLMNSAALHCAAAAKSAFSCGHRGAPTSEPLPKPSQFPSPFMEQMACLINKQNQHNQLLQLSALLKPEIQKANQVGHPSICPSSKNMSLDSINSFFPSAPAPRQLPSGGFPQMDVPMYHQAAFAIQSSSPCVKDRQNKQLAAVVEELMMRAAHQHAIPSKSSSSCPAVVSSNLHNSYQALVDSKSLGERSERSFGSAPEEDFTKQHNEQQNSDNQVLEDKGVEAFHRTNKSFPQKLYFMLEEMERQGKDNIVSFVADGTAFMIHNTRIFEAEVMPLYFASSRLASLQRQLNIYGFVRINQGKWRGSYRHECFVQGQKQQLSRIKRRCTKMSSEVKNDRL